MKEVNLRSYLEEKNITVDEFMEITGMTKPTVYRIMANPDWNLRVDHVRSIYHGTLNKYGKGLDIWQYLNK